MDNPEKARRVLDILKKKFPQPRIALDFSNPLELLIATILSAQTTDRLVNRVTPALFKKYKNAKAYSHADLKMLEGDIKGVNFYRTKAASIKRCATMIVEAFGGAVPDTIEGLTSLPGVGRKTANVVLGSAFGRDALAVDTHVKRVSRRLGLTSNDDPDRIEEDLSGIIPKKSWTLTTHLFILHGRTTCKAKNPDCPGCPVKEYCDFYKKVFLKTMGA